MSQQTKKKCKLNNRDVTKKLQTELQALIAYGAYDSDQVLRGGDSCCKDDVIKKINNLYMPNIANNDNLSHVEMFLEGKGKYSYFFETIGAADNTEEPMKIIPETMHCMDGKRITLELGCVDKSLLTRKNLSNFVDISAKTLYRHAKEVEANCKKALALCTGEGSPYHKFNGTFPSGTNRDDYLAWLREQMNSSIDTVDIDDHSDNIAQESEDNTILDKECNHNTNKNGGEDSCSKRRNKDDYFKGYFAFALWGYIPPDGGEKYKSSFIDTVVKPDIKVKAERGAKKEDKIEEKSYMQELDKRGVNKETAQLNKLADLMVKGRVEMRKQRLYQCRIDRIEFQMRYYSTRIKEINDELRELRQEAKNGDDNIEYQAELKEELKKVRKSKKEAFSNWSIVSETEEGRRALLEMEDEDNAPAVTADTVSTISKSVESPVPQNIGVTIGENNKTNN